MKFNPMAIDPATITGWAWKGRDIWECGSTWAPSVTALIPLAKVEGVTHAIVEGGYAGPNPQTTMMLAEIRANVKRDCREAGLVVIEVPPMTWKTAVLSQGGHLPKDTKAQKKLAIMVAETPVANGGLGAKLPRGKRGKIDDNAADAVCICAWALANERELAG